MSTIGAFNDMMEQFLHELVLTFPNEPAMKKYQMSFEMLRKANVRAVMETFMKDIGPYSQQLMSMDDKFFIENPEVFTEFKLNNIWNDSLSQSTKNTIWKYLQTLYMLGVTITSLPENALAAIEDVARKCAKDMKPGSFDPNVLMTGVTNMLNLEKKS
jgi:hypothetical protein